MTAQERWSNEAPPASPDVLEHVRADHHVVATVDLGRYTAAEVGQHELVHPLGYTAGAAEVETAARWPRPLT